MAQHTTGHATHQCIFEHAIAVTPHHNQINVVILRNADNLFNRLTTLHYNFIGINRVCP